jgi:hypothetical protein
MEKNTTRKRERGQFLIWHVPRRRADVLLQDGIDWEGRGDV